jgi:UDP-N-acetylmuramoylalanine-D-glutamate ligase
MKNPDLEGKRIFVLGLGLSGISAIRLCLARGAVVTGLDRKRECDLDRAILDLRKSGARILAETEVLEEFAEFLICSPGVPLSHPMLALCGRKGIPVYSESSWRLVLSDDYRGDGDGREIDRCLDCLSDLSDQWPHGHGGGQHRISFFPNRF